MQQLSVIIISIDPHTTVSAWFLDGLRNYSTSKETYDTTGGMKMISVFYLLGISILALVVIFVLTRRLRSSRQDYTKLLSQKKSSEVRLGQISEQLAPFLNQFPYNPKQCQFLGMPIDYIHFGDDKITLIEIKSGKARLSKKQRHIRDLVKDGKVEWDEIRIS